MEIPRRNNLSTCDMQVELEDFSYYSGTEAIVCTAVSLLEH